MIAAAPSPAPGPALVADAAAGAAPGAIQGGRGWRARPGLMVSGALAFCALVYLWPMLALVGWAFHDQTSGWSLAQLARVAGDEDYHYAFVTTFRIAVTTTLVSALIGYPYAYLMASSGPRLAALLGAAVMIPFWTSILARSLAWMILLGRKGVINEWLVGLGLIERPLAMLFNSLGVQIGMVHVLLPFMVLPIWAILSRLDATLPRAARSLGASPARAFWNVTFPLSLPGLAAGVALVFMSAIGFYVTPALLGGPSDLTIASLIEMVVRDLLDWPFGAILSLTLLACVAAVFAIGALVAGAGRLTGTERA
ncbi:MAG: ABC transporter permease [Acetobacteraceae bacterium]|nr:ABC transporter permease [Acetobacteraceae bacterium]